MKKTLLFIPLLGLFLSGCGISQTMQSLEYNRMAVDASTCAINENIEAIKAANRGIEENRRQLEEINRTLKKAAAG